MPQNALRSRVRCHLHSAVTCVRDWLSPRRPVSSWNRPLLPRHAYRPAVELLEDRLPPGDILGLLWLGAPAALASTGTPAADAAPESSPVAVVQVTPPADRFEQVNQAMAAYLADLDHSADAPGSFQADATPADPAPETTIQSDAGDAVNWSGVDSTDALFASNSWAGPLAADTEADHAADITPATGSAGAGTSDGEPTSPAAAPLSNPASPSGVTGPTAPAGSDANLARTASMQSALAAPSGASFLAANPAVFTAAASLPPASLLPGIANVGGNGPSFVFTLAAGQQGDLGRLVSLAAASGATVQATPLAGAYEVRGGNLPALQQTFAAQPTVASAAAPVMFHTEVLPNDPAVTNGTLWGMTGTNGINAPTAWSTTTGSTKVIVADIDTGVDYNHPDLYKNIWINQAEIPAAVKAKLTDTDGDGLITFYDLNNPVNQGVGKITDQNGDGIITAADILAPYKADGTGGWADGISEDGDTAHVDDLVGWNFVANSNNPFDDNNHGTHTAGTIAGMGNNGVGVAGVEWVAQLMPVKFIGSNGSGTDVAAAAALDYARVHGARVTSNSWGGGYSSTFENAVIRANNAGVLVVAAAGNDGQNTDTTPTYPADLPEANVISVAAMDSSGNLASFSNYGATTVDLGAPGVSIYSTIPNNSYAYFSGTSMATPHVSGTIALMLAQQPNWTVAQIRSQLLGTVTPDAALSGRSVTGGIVNAGKAVPPSVDLNWTGGGLSGLPATQDAQTAFTITRSYNITGASVPSNFTISYYASTDTTLGNADDLLIGTETISAAADKTVGLHTGSSPNLKFGRAGTQYIYAVLDSGNAVGETNEANNSLLSATAVNGTGTTDFVIDNGDPAYSETGTWYNWTTQGYNTNLRYAASGTGSTTATWQASGLAAGTYDVQVTWVSNPNRATNAPYSIYDGNTLLGTVQVNQQLNPTGTTVNGTAFQSLGKFTISSGTLKVVLSNNANGWVIADAVHFVSASTTPPPPPTTTVPVIEDNGQPGYSETGTWYNWTTQGYNTNLRYAAAGTGSTTATWQVSGLAAGSYDVQVTWVSNANRATNAPYSIYDGNTLLGTVTVNQQLDPSGTTVNGTAFQSLGTFTISSGTLKVVLSNNANGWIIADALRVAAPPPPPAPSVIIDNGQPGYSETGTWYNWTTQGYNTNLRYAAAGDGSTTATWQFGGLSAGTYDVQVTWVSNPNRASDAPYRIYDGTTLLGTVRVNQQLDPSGGATVNGTVFQSLGKFTISGSANLRVVLGNDANGWIIADAVRGVKT